LIVCKSPTLRICCGTMQAHPEWTIDQMRSYLFRTADYYAQFNRPDSMYVRGYGIVNALAALTPDCNENSVDDATDIALGTSEDCNGNGLPDECDLDRAGDYLDVDCNDNGVLDMCETGSGASDDCDYNSIPDECQPDCDLDGTPDACAVVPMGASPDVNDNRIPDECELVSAVLPASPHDAHKNRYVSFRPNNYDIGVAFQVELVEGPGSTGVLGWVSEANVNGLARVVEEPFFGTAWPDVVFLGDCEIVPVATYAIRGTVEGVQFSDPLTVATIHKPIGRYYGDVVGTGTGDMPPLPGFTPPNGNVNVSDVQAYILTAQGDSSPSVHPTWVDLHGEGEGSPPNFILNVSDLQRILFGFEGREYTDTPQQIDPADCP